MTIIVGRETCLKDNPPPPQYSDVTYLFMLSISQLSCASSSDELSDRVRFPYYFQLLPSEVNLARVFYSIIKEYGWRRVALIVQNEHRYRAVCLLVISSNFIYNIN